MVHDLQEVVVDGNAAVAATNCAVDRDPNGLMRGVNARSNAAAAATPEVSVLCKGGGPSLRHLCDHTRACCQRLHVDWTTQEKDVWAVLAQRLLGGVASLMSMGIARLGYVMLACEGWGRAPAWKRYQWAS